MSASSQGSGTKTGQGPTTSAGSPATPAAATAPTAVDQSCALIEKVLGVGQNTKKSDKGLYIDRGLYVVKQGSSYVIISVFPSGPNKAHALVRVVARVVSGVRPEPSLFRQLLILNGTLRFGAFAYDPNGEVVLFAHTLLGGSTLDVNELLATVHDVALVADGYDDRIVARYGGQRMQDVVEESAMAHLFNPDEADEDMPFLDDEEEPLLKEAAEKAATRPPAKAATKPPAKAATRPPPAAARARKPSQSPSPSPGGEGKGKKKGT